MMETLTPISTRGRFQLEGIVGGRCLRRLSIAKGPDWLLWSLALLLTVAVSGCGGSGLGLVDVSGSVTLDGNQVQVQNLEFVPKAGGRPSTGIFDEQGQYRLVYSPQYIGALAGDHKIVIEVAGAVSQELTGKKGQVTLTKELKVDRSNRVIDCELREFEIRK